MPGTIEDAAEDGVHQAGTPTLMRGRPRRPPPPVSRGRGQAASLHSPRPSGSVAGPASPPAGGPRGPAASPPARGQASLLLGRHAGERALAVDVEVLDNDSRPFPI